MLELPELPYPQSALDPYVSERTLQFHHGKHHATYVTKANDLIKDTPLAKKSLEEIIHTAARDADKAGLFNNAAQVWNHTFFWNSMSPSGGGEPSGETGKRIEAALTGIPCETLVVRGGSSALLTQEAAIELAAVLVDQTLEEPIVEEAAVVALAVALRRAAVLGTVHLVVRA